ncbi:ANTAR domain-containing protein [Streptomyces sp. NPDC023327]|uniref:ANTAR domain-containing protein n=1 Tax=Streptomyces sp. NPDC023327 TaxID=3157088 RepID=UPI0033FF51D9
MPEPVHPESLEQEGGHDERGDRTPVSRTAAAPTAGFDSLVEGERLRVVLRGELDLEAGRLLRPDLRQALRRSARVIDLDLRGVGFCDCSGLNLLLGLRQSALEQGKILTIGHSSPWVDRLLDLTGTRHLFAPVEQGGGHSAAAADHGPEKGEEAGKGEEGEQDLRAVVAQLRRAMRTRPTIDLARGMLMSSFNLDPEAAWDVLVSASQNTNTKLHRLAGELVGTVSGNALPDAVRRQLAAAIARTDTARPTPGTGTTTSTPRPASEPLGTPPACGP